MVGQTILHYQIIEKLGAGGMGEIYKAQDPRLNRFVAIKVLPAGKAGDPERRRRFVQEAQAASALNHPNIITIYDILSEGNTEYMVMEFVSGRTLLDIIPRGGLRVPQVLRYSSQMADALSTAHAAGIIHRDFKPANVMITGSDLVKVLDFGLAKLTDPTLVSSTEDAATMSRAPLTVEGSIMGTVSYMSPEQAEGKRVDSRSDIFSFGSVLYEMVTGFRAFDRDSGISTLSAVLRDEVRPIAEIAPDVPQELEQIIDGCLRKDPDARWQSMREIERALTALRRQSDSGTLYRSHLSSSTMAATGTIAIPPPVPAAPKPAVQSGLSKAILFGGIGIAILAVAAAGGWWWMNRSKPAPPPVAQSPAPAPPVVAPAPAASAATADSVLTNDSIIEMVQAKLAMSLIVSQIKSSKTNFNFSTAELIRLSKAGVPENLIRFMRDPNSTAPREASAPREATAARETPASRESPAPKDAAAPPAVLVPKEGPVTRANSPVPPSRPSSVPVQTTAVTVADGLPFRILLADDVPADAAPDQALRFTVPDGLKVDDAVVVAKGAIVTGSIVAAAGKKNVFGKSGKMTFRLAQADTVDGKKLSVRATPAHGANGSPTRPLDTGKGAKSKELAAARGAEYIAYTDGQQTVSVRK